MESSIISLPPLQLSLQHLASSDILSKYPLILFSISHHRNVDFRGSGSLFNLLLSFSEPRVVLDYKLMPGMKLSVGEPAEDINIDHVSPEECTRCKTLKLWTLG